MSHGVGGGDGPASELGIFVIREVRCPEVTIVLSFVQGEGSKFLLIVKGCPGKLGVPRWIPNRQEALNELDRQVHNHSRHVTVTVREDS